MKLRTPARPGHPRRTGTVVVVVAIALVVILAFVALSLDGGILLDKRRQAQCTSDAAALAAAGDMYSNWWANKGTDPTGTAKAAAKAAANYEEVAPLSEYELARDANIRSNQVQYTP